jgi:predicted nucleic acid-binding protein
VVKYIDTDVFVYWATDHPEHGQRATEIIRRIETSEKAITSALSFWTFNNLMRTQNGFSLRLFLDQVKRLRNLRIIALDADTLAAAGDLVREKNLSPHVAVAAAVAKAKGADAVYTTNSEFDRVGLKRTF